MSVGDVAIRNAYPSRPDSKLATLPSRAAAYGVGVRPRYALAVVALLCGVVLVAGGGFGPAPGDDRGGPPDVLLGVAREDGVRWLVRVAPDSLRPLRGPRHRLAAPVEAWAPSPDDGRLATVSERGSVLDLIDVPAMRSVDRVPTGARGSPLAVLWPRPDRLWIVLAVAGSTTVVTVDPSARTVVATRRLAGGLARVAASADGPVMVLAPPAVVGPARLVKVDAAGAARQLALDGVSAGAMPTDVAPSVERVRAPALAVDPRRRRAYVLSSRPYVIEVDLERWRTSGHRLLAEASLLDRLRELLEPTAEAAVQAGPVRTATWIGDGRIALSGYDGDVVWRPGGDVESERRPAGLHVIDTRDWRVRTVDERASAFASAAGLLLTGGRGLAAYSEDGARRFEVLGDRRLEIVATAGSLAYVRTHPRPELHTVDLASGRVVGTSAPRRARLLLEHLPQLP